MPEPKYNKWCITYFFDFNDDNLKNLILEFFNLPFITKYVFQTEITGTCRHHIQGFFKMNVRKRLSTLNIIAREMGLCEIGHPHFERANGTDRQNYVYCTKESSRAEPGFSSEKWDFSSDNNDSEWIQMIAALQAGATESHIALNYPRHYLRYSRGIQQMITLRTVPKHRAMTVIVLIGPPGTGKSFWARQYCHTQNLSLYCKQLNVWWDCYDQEKAVLFDDFGSGMINITHMLRWLDVYAVRGQVKGSTVPLNYNTVIITTNLCVQQWYPDAAPAHLTALRRRLDHVINIFDGQRATDTVDFKELKKGRDAPQFE